MSGPGDIVVRVDGLTRRFGERVVLAPLSLTVRAGEFVALLGKSGSGKSTLLRALAQLDAEVQGEGRVQVPAECSVLFQDARLLPWETVLDNVTLGLRTPQAAEQGRAALAQVGLAGRESAWPNALSGGEQQRVALARSLVRAPRLLLADEPFGALDALTRLRMQGLLRSLVERHRPAVVLVTHDVDEALVLADRVLLIDEGRIAFDQPIDLPHPRRSTTPAFDRLRSQWLEALGVPADV
ncbi:MAG: ABC transporter ATP-binding protein [Burkholderiaceae bacterium]|nr:ABC transporter ATP-binding protein [Burkholderiaceae bacterium]